jgi:galactofuranosylgalactofuranosylrhamnosyl-N-acetylglucosaminyl-diphospho-decaprenol beta-1,5/1,6-galactofuranosyltransferase
MNIVGGINLPKSADASDLYIQCNEAASINYQKDDTKVSYIRAGLYPQILTLIHFTRNFILNIQL